MNRPATAVWLLLLSIGIPGIHLFGQTNVRLGLMGGLNAGSQTFSRDLFTGAHPRSSRFGFLAGGLAEFFLSDRWLIHIESRYIQKGVRFENVTVTGVQPTPSGNTDATFKINYIDVPIFLKARLPGEEGWRIAFFGGPAFAFRMSGLVEAPGTHVMGRTGTSTVNLEHDLNSFEAAFEVGGGGEYRISRSTSLLLDLRFTHGLNDLYSNPSLPSAQSFGFLLTAGVVFGFGEQSPPGPHLVMTSTAPRTSIDTDGDGLTDADEIGLYKTNPYQPDSDGDGLTDAEEILRYKTNPLNGDTDDDGLNDGAEVRRYKTDPLDPDTDHGGVKDGPEVFRGTNPLDASDDFPRKEEFKVEVGKSIVLEGIVFQTASADISPASAAVLEKAFNTLEQNPEIAVEIHGHTDNVGKHAYNMTLSLARANSVKSYLLQRGIADHRIFTKGFGFERPIASNDTPEGRQRNRRIEFFRIR